MQNEIRFGGFFKNNRKVENCLVAVGIALFVVLGMRGLNKISDRAVAAGEAQRSVAVNGALHALDADERHFDISVEELQPVHVQSDQKKSLWNGKSAQTRPTQQLQDAPQGGPSKINTGELETAKSVSAKEQSRKL